MVEQVSIIKAKVRNILGSAESRRLRKSGLLPATVRNGNDIFYISIDQKEFDKRYFGGGIFSVPILLDVDGKKIDIIANDVDIHPTTDRPIHVDFNQIDKDKEVKVRIKLNFVGEDKSLALKRGGFLHINIRMVDLICKDVSSIPENIDVDISTLLVSGKIRSDNLVLPSNTSLKGKKEFLIASILGRGGSKSEESEESGEEGELGNDSSDKEKAKE